MLDQAQASLQAYCALCGSLDLQNLAISHLHRQLLKGCLQFLLSAVGDSKISNREKESRNRTMS